MRATTGNFNPSMENLLQNLQAKYEQVKLGGGATRIEKEHAKGKLTARERIDHLLDKHCHFPFS